MEFIDKVQKRFKYKYIIIIVKKYQNDTIPFLTWSLFLNYESLGNENNYKNIK